MKTKDGKVLATQNDVNNYILDEAKLAIGSILCFWFFA